MHVHSKLLPVVKLENRERLNLTSPTLNCYATKRSSTDTKRSTANRHKRAIMNYVTYMYCRACKPYEIIWSHDSYYFWTHCPEIAARIACFSTEKPTLFCSALHRRCQLRTLGERQQCITARLNLRQRPSLSDKIGTPTSMYVQWFAAEL